MFIASLFSSLVLSSVSAALPTLYKSSINGFVPPQFVNSMLCKIEGSQVTITLQKGEIESTIEKSIEVEKNLLGLFQASVRGEVVHTPAPTDGPTTTWNARQEQASGVLIFADLKAVGSIRFINRSEAAAILVEYIDAACAH